MRVQNHSQCKDGYMELYLTISNPHIIPLAEHTEDARPYNVGAPANDVSLLLPPTDVDEQQRLQMIAFIIDNLMGLLNPYDEVLTRLSRVTHIARWEPI